MEERKKTYTCEKCGAEGLGTTFRYPPGWLMGKTEAGLCTAHQRSLLLPADGPRVAATLFDVSRRGRKRGRKW